MNIFKKKKKRNLQKKKEKEGQFPFRYSLMYTQNRTHKYLFLKLSISCFESCMLKQFHEKKSKSSQKENKSADSNFSECLTIEAYMKKVGQ